MLLSLSEIIEVPGAEKLFDCTLVIETLPGIERLTEPVHAAGRVRNMAGALMLEAIVTADMICACDRCGTEFYSQKEQEISVPVAVDLIDEESPDIFPLSGDDLDIGEVIETCLILEMETKFLCRPDCAGLCQVCGANLNDGSCSCVAETDPRLAVLGQLLDIDND